MKMIQGIINTCIRENVLKCVYLEKPIDNELSDIHLYFIYKDPSQELIRLKGLIENNTSIIYYNNPSRTNILHVITDDGLSLYIHKVTKVYNFSRLVVLYNPANLEVVTGYNDEVAENLIEAINEYASQLHKVYRFLQTNNPLLALSCLAKVNEAVMVFLANFHTKVSYSRNSFHADMEEVMKLMDKDNFRKYVKIISMLKYESIDECSRLFIWFMDEYIGNIPIGIAQHIDIDYYLYVKNVYNKTRN